MNQSVLRLFLTFVLMLVPTKARAAISSPSPDFQDPSTPLEPNLPPPDLMIQQTVDVANPPVVISRVPEKSEFFYKYRKALSIRAGLFERRALSSSDGPNRGSVLGLLYLFPGLFSGSPLRSFEVGADLLSNGKGALHAARRFEFSRGLLRPFAKAGFGVRIVPSEQLVSFLKISNYQIRLGGGLERTVRGGQSVRLDLEGILSTDMLQGLVTFGYAWAW